MFSTGLSGDLKHLIKRITPGFEENLVRAFKNEGVRWQQTNNNNRNINELDSVLISVDDTKIELANLKFPWTPDFRIIKLSADLSMLCLDVAFKLGDLRTEGDYEATNMTLQRLLPITNNGRIETTFRDVVVRGKVGLLIEGDSFVPENYDIEYESTETSISVKYYVNNQTEVENNVVRAKEDDIIGGAIWKQLKSILTRILHKQLGESVVQFSLTELLEDEDEELREKAKEYSSKANRLVDSLLCSAKDYLVAKNFRSIETPPFNVVYRGKPSGVYQGRLHTGVGYIQDLSTLSRMQDLSFYEDKQKLIVFGSLSLREMKHGYEHFRSQYENIQVSGSIKTTIYENRIFIKCTILKDQDKHCKTSITTVEVRWLRDIDVDASGLGSLSWLVPKLEAWVVGNLIYTALPVLESYIKEAFEDALAKTNCTALVFQ
nr:unnamed protein product [Callosobruchus analis]